MTKKQPRWPMLHQVEGRAIRTQQMIDRLKVDPLQLVRIKRGETYRRVHEACLQCRSADTCRTWLQSQSEDPVRPDFCPNLNVFMSCIAISGNKKDDKKK
ncbi:MAG: DUF6455 family protein [Pseudomonadota bacterium]